MKAEYLQMEIDRLTTLSDHYPLGEEGEAQLAEFKALKKIAERDTIKLSKCTRVEVIDNHGRSYTNSCCNLVGMQMQDDDRTMKIFIS